MSTTFVSWVLFWRCAFLLVSWWIDQALHSFASEFYSQNRCLISLHSNALDHQCLMSVVGMLFNWSLVYFDQFTYSSFCMAIVDSRAVYFAVLFCYLTGELEAKQKSKRELYLWGPETYILIYVSAVTVALSCFDLFSQVHWPASRSNRKADLWPHLVCMKPWIINCMNKNAW